MSKGSLLCSLALVQLWLISSFQLTGGDQAVGEFLCQDPIVGRPPLMSNHGREEHDGSASGDSIFDEEELSDEGLSVASDGGGGVAVEGEEGCLPDEDGGGGGAKGNSSGSGGVDVECPECGKFFKNDKSMFGHLRSHPNRGYRGATPPVNKLKLSPETAAASPPPSPPSRGTHQPCPRRDRRLIPLEIVAPYALLTLQCRDNRVQAAQQEPPRPPPCFHGSDTNVGVTKRGGSGGRISSSIVAAEAHADEYSGSVLKIPKKRRNMLKETREYGKKAKLVPPPLPPPKEKGAYICKHCYAEFSTHQALGGHMAGHHRDKKVQTPNDASSRAQQRMAAQSQDGKLQVKGGGDDDDDGRHDSGLSLRRGLISMASNVPRHSGQASGGQMIEMRQQHSGRRSDGLTLAAPAPAPAQADDSGGRRLLNFDLNAEATEQE